MSRAWFSTTLETVATWWRIERRDGVTLGFTSHDHDIAFDGLLHRTAPGMVPSAIRRTATFEADSAEIAGALSHDSIREDDLAAGRFDGARVVVGLVDWETREHDTLYAGTIGAVGREGAGFSAELRSIKAMLDTELVPRTAPTCRADFCGTGCTLSALRFSHEAWLSAVSTDGTAVQLTLPVDASRFAFGTLRWVDGVDAGEVQRIEDVADGWLVLERPIDPATPAGLRATLREGCDHTLDTCATRFANAINFQGEPFLPGNDLLARYPAAQS
ncbi:DUF2163 domain-containing protein [Novosphingobium lentum]|uniref:DUF2163 domain-containing protein n=1 Tax=Novosphingobium lentum TaxID=145287 RepID=UPI0008339F49|nr:DUF2163 domain-containing protein [Novosphingobium lentum]